MLPLLDGKKDIVVGVTNQHPIAHFDKLVDPARKNAPRSPLLQGLT